MTMEFSRGYKIMKMCIDAAEKGEREKAIEGCKLFQKKPVACVSPNVTPRKQNLPELLIRPNEIPRPLSLEIEHHGGAQTLSNIDSVPEPNANPLEHELGEYVGVLVPCTNSETELNDSPNVISDEEYIPSTDESTYSVKEDVPKKPIKGNKKQSDEKKGNEEEKKIVINEVVKDDRGKVIRNKGHCCMFCYKVMVNLPRHLEIKHSTEIEVAKLLAIPKNSIARRTGFIDLSRIGDYYHNIEVLTKKTGELILVRRPSPGEDVSYNKYSPCPYCLGFMLKKHLWHHVKHSCTVKRDRINNEPSDKVHRRVLVESRVLLMSSLNRDQPAVFVENILKHMRDDVITEICKDDPLILKVGILQFEKYGQTQGELIRQQMRQLGRLLMSLRELSGISNDNTLKDWLEPSKFDQLIEAVKHVCIRIDQNSQTLRPEFKIPSLALKLGHSLRKCIGIERGIALRSCDKTKNESLKDLLNLMELEWSVKISSNALATLYSRKLNKTNALPLTSDLVKLNEFLLKEMKTEANEAVLHWSRLAELTLCRLILFNKRRSGEAAKLRLETYLSTTKSGECSEDMQLSLSKIEKKLTARMGLVETIGKRGKKVPIILAPDIKQSLEKLINGRREAGVNQNNEYVFARVGDSLKHIRGHDCLRKFCKEAKVDAPHMITSTNLRKYIATVVQIFDMTENETDWLARHLGHDIRVHREFYRTHESIVETAKISRILLAVEKGKAHLFQGKKLEDINVDDLNITDDSNVSPESSEEVDMDRNLNLHLNTDPGVVPVCTDVCNHKKQTKSTTIEAESSPNANVKKPSRKEAIKTLPDEGSSTKRLKINKQPIYSSSDSDEDFSVITKRTKVKKSCDKRPWTGAEKETVLTYFRTNISKGIIPRKEQCDSCKIGSSDVLKNRSWKDIKYYIYNHIKKVQKNIK